MSLEKKATKFDELLVSIGMRMLQHFTTEGVSLSIKEMMLIEILGRRDSATMSEMALALSLPLTTMTSVVTRMVHQGYLERRRIEEDRRVVLVSLTDYGRSIYNQHRQEHISMSMVILRAMPLNEQDQIIGILEKIATVLAGDSKIVTQGVVNGY